MAGSGERKSKKDDNGIGTAIDFVLSNARLVLGVGGAAMLGIATLAVKRVSALRPGQARPGIGEVVRLPSGADLEEDCDTADGKVTWQFDIIRRDLKRSK